jgi:3',5'-cyclic AMP phosphodiesterase CpdA
LAQGSDAHVGEPVASSIFNHLNPPGFIVAADHSADSRKERVTWPIRGANLVAGPAGERQRMARGRVQVGVAAASLVLVLAAAGMSARTGWDIDFAQYQGTGEPPSDFRFVIVGDRTGDPQWGLMTQAFREINCLDPDFVISVGDLIDGYGNDPRVIMGLWEEFDSEVGVLARPFVYVPGNHDIWNATSRGVYEARYGPTYRSFNYRGLHFVTLDTEQPGERGRVHGRIQGQQLEWLKQDLERSRRARHILLFMHRPVWETGGLDDVYPLLEGLPVHIFAGHHHRYSFQRIRGIPHVVLSAVAGGMVEEGAPETGNLRHYIFATARDSELKLALVRLGGVMSQDVTVNGRPQ